MATIDDYGKRPEDTLAAPPLGGPDGWAAAVAAAIKVAVPPGVCVPFHGTVIPTGWAICDGTRGTPNLVDRFVRGRATPATTGDAGGAATVTLSIANMPPHGHGGATGDDTPDHHHDTVGWTDTPQTGAPYKFVSGTSSFGNLSTSGAMVRHKHSIPTEGGGQPFNIVPPYYEMVWIMKLGAA